MNPDLIGYSINYNYSLFQVPHVLVLPWHWHTNKPVLLTNQINKKTSVWTGENRHSISKSVDVYADLIVILWSFWGLHNYKTSNNNYSLHALYLRPSYRLSWLWFHFQAYYTCTAYTFQYAYWEHQYALGNLKHAAGIHLWWGKR